MQNPIIKKYSVIQAKFYSWSRASIAIFIAYHQIIYKFSLLHIRYIDVSEDTGLICSKNEVILHDDLF
jgi:hypothetical protein